MLEYEQSEKLVAPAGSGRHLLMLQCTEREFLPYCIRLLVACLKVCVCVCVNFVCEPCVCVCMCVCVCE